MHKVIFFMFFLFYGAVHASTIDSMITINQTSTSGKTLLIDKGEHHSIVFDDYGILLKKYTENKKNIYKPVAKMKAVKVFGETSIWVVFKTFIPAEIKKGSRLMLLSESTLLSGRSALKVSRNKIVGHQNIITKQVNDSMTESTEGLSKKESKYGVIRKLHDREKHYDSDVELVDIDVWEDKNKDKNYRPTAIFKSPYAKEFSERKRVDSFEKMVVAFVQKYDDPKFTLKSLYYQQRKDPVIDTFPDKSAGGTYYDRYIEEQEKVAQKEKKIMHDLRSKGESWSDDYSDEELSELVYNVGVLQEQERRNVIAAHRFNHQFYGNFGLNLLNNENLQDKNNTEQSKYDLEFSWEYYFLKDINFLNRFSVEFGGRRSQDAFSIGGGYNSTIVEYSLSTQINWYPFMKANVLERNILYFGMLFRAGLARMKIADTQEEGNYQLSTLPGFRAGVKYNFQNSWGVRMQLGYENINVSRIVRTYDGGILPDRANYLEGKLSFGISKFY